MKVPCLKILLLLIGFNVGLSAQNYHIERHLTVDDGLPSNETYSTFQTDDGDLWICTDRGLARYNGISMQVYDEDDGLADNVVFKSYKDYSGRIWLITAGGLSYLEGDSIISPGFNEQLVNHRRYTYINNIHVSVDRIYIGTKEPINGYFQINLDRGDELVFQHVDELFSSGCAEIMFFLRENENILINSLVGTSHSMNCKDTILVKKLSSANKNIQFMASEVIDFDQNIFTQEFHSDKKVNYFSIHNHIFSHERNEMTLWKTFDKDVLALYRNDNHLYIGLRGQGVHVYDIHKGSLERKFGHGLVVLDIKQFAGEQVWVNTMNSGVYQFNLVTYTVGSIPDSIELSLSGTPINIRNDTLRIFSKGAINSYLMQEDSLVYLKSRSLLDGHERFFRFNRVNWDQPGLLSLNYGYIRYSLDQEGLTYTPTITRGRGIKESSVINRDSTLYLGNRGFIIGRSDSVIYDSRWDGFEEEVNSYLIINGNNYFLGTFQGLYEYRGKGDIIDWGDRYGLLSTRIEVVEQIGGEQYIIGTQGNGLCVLTGDSIMAITKENGLLSDIVQDVVFDGEQLWVATNRGLSRVSLKHRQSGDISFGAVETVLRAVYIDELFYDGGNKVYAQSGKDIFRIDYPESLDIPRPEILLDEIAVSGVVREVDWRSSYSFTYDENAIRFDYRINELLEPHQQIYEYRLKGRSNTWSRTSERNFKLANLPPGNYRLEMKARNSYGQWSEEPQWLEFEIRPHFTQTGWFRYGGSAATAFLLGGIVFVYVRNRHRKLARENFLLNSALNSLKLEMNPHFIFNALNSIQYFIANNQRREANMFLARFATLIRNVLNATDQKKLSLREEVSKLRDYLELERIRMHRHFSHKITFTNDFDHDKTYLPPMLIQPLIENAIWHGVSELDRPGEILVKFNLAKGILSVVVEDNGKGMDKNVEVSLKMKSRGLRNIESRLELMSQIERKPYSMSIDSEPCKGTRVELKIPQ